MAKMVQKADCNGDNGPCTGSGKTDRAGRRKRSGVDIKRYTAK